MRTKFSEAQLAGLQSTAKRSRNFYRLDAPTTIEHEFTRQLAHSSFAFTRFECAPSNELVFEATASWPPSVSPVYAVALERAIAEGVADGLLDGLYPHTGCHVTLVETRYDEIGSSEAAFLWAATAAMRKLTEQKWTIVPRPHQ